MNIQRCVIPLAGLGTRLYPATKSVPKALFPIVDADGQARPLIHVLLEEAASAGIEEVGLVIHPSQMRLLQAYFEDPAPPGIRRDPQLAKEAETIFEWSRRLVWIPQDVPLGFGDAVLRAKGFTGQDPFLVLLGDHLFRSRVEKSCSCQLAQAFFRHGVSVMGIVDVAPEDLSRVASIEGLAVQEDLYEARRVLEKPGASWWETQSSRPDRPLGALGIDAFTAEIFEPLERIRASLSRPGQEVQLRDGQDALARQERLLALRVRGERYDLGEPSLYASHVDALRHS